MSIQQQLGEPGYWLEGFNFYTGTSQSLYYPEHCHDDLEIAIIHNHGSAQVMWEADDGQSQQQYLMTNELCIVPSRQPHGFRCEEAADSIFVFIHPKFLMQTAQDLIQGDSIEIEGQFAIASPLIHSLVLTIRSIFRSQELIDHLYVDSLVNVLVMHLLKVYAGCQFVPTKKRIVPARRWLREVIDYIHNSLDKDLRLAKLAMVANMSESNFCHLFKEQMGTSPHQYVIRQRVERARLLLIEDKISIADIAYQCGFNSQSHMTIYFRQHTGMTPKAYRSSH